MTSILYRIFVLGLPLVFFLSYLAPQAYLTYGFSTNKGNFQAVTNQTNLNGDGKLTVTVAGNTHLVGASMVGKLGTDLTTGTLTTQDLENKASYQSMSAGVNYSANSSDKGSKSTGGYSPTIGLPQDKSKHSTTQASIGENTHLTITNQAAQTQDVSAISRDTQTSGFTMTEINTEVIGIRSDLSSEASQVGFKAVGDLAMKNGWEDGSVEKTIAHAVVGATVAAIGNGDALSGAIGAGAAEAARPATANEDTATQETVSTLVGALAGGGTGASVGLDGEKFNRQLHQKEIKWIEAHAGAYADKTGLSLSDAKTELTEQALRGVDKGWSLKLGDTDNTRAKAFLEENDAQMFTTKSDSEYYDPTITRYGDTTTKIKDLDQSKKDALKDFYKNNVKNASTESLKELYISDLKTRGVKNAEAVWEGIKNTPEGLKSLYEYIDKTPLGELGSDIVDGVKNIAKDVKDTATQGADAYQSSSEIAHNTDGTADLLNDLYDDDTAATAGRMMVDEDLFEAATLVGGLGKGAITGIKKLGNGKVEITAKDGKTIQVDEKDFIASLEEISVNGTSAKRLNHYALKVHRLSVTD